MVRIISALLLAVMAAYASAQDALRLVDSPPDRHVVVRGDTLWGIAGKFLKEPWRWPEIWRLNREAIHNPHRIYPGDLVILDLSSGQPRLKLAKPLKLQPQVHGEALAEEIPSIPSAAITPFLSQPLIVEARALDQAPHIVASQEDRVFLGHGDTAFVSGLSDTRVVNWQVYRPGKALKDPETGEVIGYESFFLGSARLIQPGEPAVFRITVAKEEIGRGDRLVPAPPLGLIAYVPHAPEQALAGQVMSIYGGVNEAGKYAVVSLNRGTRDGLEVGHVLALFRQRSAQSNDDQGRRKSIPIPEERYALSFVFRTFERVSYALIMEASKPVIVGDAVRNP